MYQPFSLILILSLFLLIAADGQALIWELPASLKHESAPAGMDGSNSGGELTLLPIARLRDFLSSGMSRQQVVFDPETSILHTCCNERKIR